MSDPMASRDQSSMSHDSQIQHQLLDSTSNMDTHMDESEEEGIVPDIPATPDARQPSPTPQVLNKTTNKVVRQLEFNTASLEFQANKGTTKKRMRTATGKAATGTNDPDLEYIETRNKEEVFYKRKMPDFKNWKDAVFYAESVLAVAVTLAENNLVHNSLMSVSNTVREYLHSGIVQNNQMMKNQINSLESTIKTLSKRMINPKPANTSINQPKSFAQVAATTPVHLQPINPPKPVKSTPKPKPVSIRSRQITLIREKALSFDPVAIRDRMNRALNTKSPAISTIQKARTTNNLIITTTLNSMRPGSLNNNVYGNPWWNSAQPRRIFHGIKW